MNLVIYEDEEYYINYLKNLIETNYLPVNIGFISRDYKALENYLLFLDEPTIFLLDIVFENDDNLGFDAFNLINENTILYSSVIFITNYPDRILVNPFYKTRSFNFILKYNEETEKLLKRTKKDVENEIIDSIRRAIKSFNRLNFYYNDSKRLLIYILIDEINYITKVKSGKKLVFYCNNSRTEIQGTLKDVIKKLPSNFIRCHDSYIVNVDYIRSVDKKERSITLFNKAKIYYSYTRKNHLLKALAERNKRTRTGNDII